jgi:predicted nucleotidyltransferase component of viral defense system
VSITNQDLLQRAQERTGLARNQLLLMVAKSAAVRHIAMGPHSEHFVLKGGTLLTHAYSSPRQSIQDADYLHRQAETVTGPELEQALIGDSRGIAFDPAFSFDAGQEQFHGTVEFTFEDIVIRRSKPLKVSVSVRPGEWLDPPRALLDYHDPLLAEDSMFKIQGLSLNELAAEKLLGWCSKDLVKHLVDLAYIAREHPTVIDHDLVARLVTKKFAHEGSRGRYRALGITRVTQLPGHFTNPQRLEDLLRGRGLDDLFFALAEQRRPQDQTLTSATNIERLALDFWKSTLELLSGTEVPESAEGSCP